MAHLIVLFEHAAGYSLFKSAVNDGVLDFHKSVKDINAFKNVVEVISFQPFKTGRDALENINCISEGILHSQLQEFLENNVPKSKKKRPIVLGVSESKLGAAISEKLGITCSTSGIVPEIIRGIRFHFHKLVPGFNDLSAANKSQLGLGHHYSRARVKFNVNRIDNMIIQSIALLDQLDKDINTFSMRVREWYSHHFPELVKVVPENNLYIQCVQAIKDRKELAEDLPQQLEDILNDPVKVQKILEVANSSMGMDISAMDLENVYLFAERILALMERRKAMMEYLRSKMHSVAPNLATLIGETVGARLIAHAGSLINLAKCPASTVQILGAEKALFRALKTRGNTPKYGLIYHSRFIGKASKGNKGRISRYLANKCSVASRIDCFRDIPTDVFGSKLREQVENRLKFYETGELPEKNIDVMDKALEEAEVAQAAILKQIKKAKKKAKRKMEESRNDSTFFSSGPESSFAANDSLSIKTEPQDEMEADSVIKKKKKKKSKKSLDAEEMMNDVSMGDLEEVNMNGAQSPKKKKKHSFVDDSQGVVVESAPESPKKKKKHSLPEEDTFENGLDNESISLSSKKKKKKKRKTLEAEG